MQCIDLLNHTELLKQHSTQGQSSKFEFGKSRGLKGDKPTYSQSSENPLNKGDVLTEAPLIWLSKHITPFASPSWGSGL